MKEIELDYWSQNEVVQTLKNELEPRVRRETEEDEEDWRIKDGDGLYGDYGSSMVEEMGLD